MKRFGELFSSRERRGILVLLPVLLVCAWVIRGALNPDFGDGPTGYIDEKKDSTRTVRAAETETGDSLFVFDPNTVDFHSLVRLGFTRSEALGIVKYRARGKVFEIKEDFASCYTVSERMYRRLEPYIHIGTEYALQPFERKAGNVPAARASQRDTLPLVPFRLDTATVAYLSRIGFSRRQAEVLVSYRDMRGGLRDMAEVEECYVVNPRMADRLRPYLIFDEKPAPGPVELNTADSAALRSVYGIGEKSVKEIIEYRRRLGGFYRVEQLAEVRGITERNYEAIIKQIRCDSCEIQKIDINFAPAEALSGHPYLPPAVLRKLLKTRQLKGGWTTIGELVKDNIMSEEQAARIAPYLRFGTQPYN